MSVERSARERMGVGTAKQSGVKNEEDIRKPIVVYFVTEKERRRKNVMEKDGAQRKLRTEERLQRKKRIIIRE